MTKTLSQDEKLDWLLNALCQESDQYRNMQFKESEKRRALRSLMNLRPPKPATEDFIRIQNEFLKTQAQEKGIVPYEALPTVKETLNPDYIWGEKVSLWQGDITRLKVDGIVNAANSRMLGCFAPYHGCIDNAIHSAAGIGLREECFDYMRSKKEMDPNYEEPTGGALVTRGYNLPCRKVIHTVGPIVQGELTRLHRDDLRHCYEAVLEAALENNLRSIALCCISTGEFRFPNEAAAESAVEVVEDFLNKHHDRIDRIVFNVFKELDREIYARLLSR